MTLITWILPAGTFTGMRPLIVFFGVFVYVAMDITANNGSSVRGWMSFLSSVARTTGLL